LKLVNILPDEHGYPQISDFGTMRLLNLNATFTQRVGSPLDTAPEMYESVEYIQAVDV
jgi:serine/threonine protein kinase